MAGFSACVLLSSVCFSEPNVDKITSSDDEEESAIADIVDTSTSDSSNVDIFGINRENYEITEEGLLYSGKNWLINRREDISSGVNGLGNVVDGFFSNEEADYSINKSYLRLTLAQSFEPRGVSYFKAKLSGKIDLPNTKDRWKLVFESDSDQAASLDEKNRGLETTDIELLDNTDNALGALRYIITQKKTWRVDWDNGVKTPLPLNVFTRVRFKRGYQLVNDWSLQVRQAIHYFHHDGFGSLGHLEFAKQVCVSCFFSNKFEVQFSDAENMFEFANIGSMTYILDVDSAVKFSLGTIAESQPNPRIVNYYVRANYRYRLYDDWLYGSIIPDFDFPREEDFHLRPSLTFKLEVLFEP